MKISKTDIKKFEEIKRSLEKKRTQGFKKLNNYFLEVVKSDTFQNAVGYIRNMYYIPKKGFPSPFKEGAIDLLMPHEDPKEWVYGGDKEENDFFTHDIEMLCRRFFLYHDTWRFVIRNYIFFNRLPDLDKNIEEIYDLCEISDIEAEKEELKKYQKYKKYKNLLEAFVSQLAERDMLFPVRINVSPYASKRDILDFIQKNYDYIKEIQNKHKMKGVKIGKIRSRNPLIQKRNQFIYENRHRPLKEIRKLIVKQFKGILDNELLFMDDGYIGKIISLEKKSRKEM